MNLDRPLAHPTSSNGSRPADRAGAAYLAGLRDDPVLARLAGTYVPLSLVTALGPSDAKSGVAAADRLVLVAPPGAGKTMTLRAVLHQLSGVAGGRCPVYVDLSVANSGEGLEDLVARALSAAGGHGLTINDLGPALLLLDNLDQATDVYLLEGLELFLRAGGQAGPGVVMACREADWPAYRSWFEDVAVGELQPLTPHAVTEALHQHLPATSATAAERWMARDRALATAARSPRFLHAFCSAVRDRPPDRWRRGQVLDSLLDGLLASVPTSERSAFRTALADVALTGLGQGQLVEVDTVAMGLGVTRDDMIRTGAVVARGPALQFVEPLLAQHCAAMALAERGAADPGQLARRLGDLTDPRKAETLVHVFSLAPDAVAFVASLLGFEGGPELAARCLAEPDAADPGGPSGAGAVVGALCEREPPVTAPLLYRLGEALVRSGEPAAAEIALRAALARTDDGTSLDQVFHRPDVDGSPPVDDWVREFLRQRNRGLALRGMREEDASTEALGEAARALGRLDADLTFEQGLAASDRGDLLAARLAFEAAVATDPDRARYVYHLGRTLVALGHHTEAIGYLQRARDLAPNRAEVEAAVGEAYRAQEWVEEALMSFEAAIRLAPGEATYQQLAAELQAELGDLDAAAARMVHAVARRPNEAAWQDALGQVLAELGRWPAAARAYRAAHDLEPGAVGVMRHLGRAQLACGEAAAAVDTLRRAASSAPQEAGVHAALARALAANGNQDQAIAALERAVALDAGWPGDFLLLARLCRESAHLERALAAAAEAVRLAPASAAALAELGRVHDARGEHREALAAYNRAMAQAPEQPEYRRFAAAVRQGLGDDAGAARDLAVALNLAPESPSALAQLARLHEDRGETAEAAAVWLRAAELAPESADYHRRAAALCLTLGQADDAVAQLKALVAVVPEDGGAHALLAEALRAAGEDERALGVLRRAARLAPERADIRADLARTALDLGRYNEARAAVDLCLVEAADQAELHGLKARIELALGDAESARESLQQAASLDPVERSYRLQLADLCQFQDGDASRRLLEDLAATAPDAAVSQRLAAMHAAAGAWSRAADEYARARESSPEDPALVAAHGTALRQSGRLEEAIQVLEEVQRRSPSQAVAGELAMAYEAMGQGELALAMFAEVARGPGAEAGLLVAWSRLALRHGQADVAIEAAQQAVAARPDMPDAYAALGAAFEARGLQDAALTAIRRGGDLAPGETVYRAAEARLAQELGRYEEAIAALEEGIAASPEVAELHFALGLAFDSCGWKSEARAAIARAAELAPENAMYRRSLAALLADVDAVAALEALHQAVAVDPDDAESYFQLGQLHLQREDPETALVQLQRAVRLRPEEAVYHRFLADSLARLNRPGAKEALQASLERDPGDAATLAALGRLYAAEGRYPAALDALAAATQLQPEVADYWRQLGTLRLAREDHTGAVDALSKAMDLAPDEAEGASALGVALERLGRPEEAAEWYRQAARLAAEDPASHLRLARARLAAGDPAAAGKALDRALSLAPGDGRALRLMAEVQLVAGDSEAALHFAQRATAADGGDGATWRCLALAQRATGDLAAAVAALDHAAELQPDDPATLRLRAEVAEDAGDWPATRAALRNLLAQVPQDVAAALRFGALVAADGWGTRLVTPHPAPAMAADDAATAEEVLAGMASGENSQVAAQAARSLAEIRGRAGDVAGAIAAAEAAAARDEGPDCLLLLAWARLLGEDAVGALESIGLARALGADGANVHMLAGRAYGARGEHALAAEAYRLAVAYAPELAEAHAGYAAACEALGRNGEALAAFNQAQELAPRAEWQKAIGRLALLVGHTDTALQALESRVRTDPADADARRGLARARIAAGDLDGATTTMLQAVTLDPARAEWQAELAEMHRAAGDGEQARACYQRALVIAPAEDAYRLLDGELALEMGQLEEARTSALTVLDRNPKSAGAHLLLGRLALATGNLETAAGELRTAADSDPEDGRAQHWLGICAKSMGDAPAAVRHLEGAARLRDATPDTYAALGELYAEAGHLDDAIQAYEQAVRLDPDATSLELRLGAVYQAAGLIEQALAHYQRAATMAPEDPRPRHAMGQAHLAARAPDRAVEALEEALALDPNAVGVYFDAGLAYKELRDYGRAAEMFRRVTRLQPANASAYTQFAAVSALQFLDRSNPERRDD